MAKKPIQETIHYKGTDYICQKLSGLDAFMLREESSDPKTGMIDFGRLIIELIDRCVLQPNLKAADIDHPDDIRDFGLLLYEFNYGRPEADKKKNQDEQEEKEED